MRTLLLLLLLSFNIVFAQKAIPEYEEYLKPFYHGVASGDPLQDRIIIWTRYTPEDIITQESFAIKWEFAEDVTFSNIIQTGVVYSEPENDFTVKVDVKNLDPGKHYYYRFISPEGIYSLIGRTKTAPSGTVNHIRLAVMSCSSIYSGYFNSYRRIASRGDLDAVIHLGDYIYEFVDPEERIRVPEPEPRDVTTMEEFRAVHRYYKLDLDFMAAHQQHPWIIIWDNHDIGKESNEDQEELRATMKAFYEWTPTRIPDSSELKNIYRSFHFGDLLDIYMLDVLVHKDENLDAFNPSVDSENRSILGSQQYNWLTEQLDLSKGKWRIMGSQKQMGQFMIFGLPDNFPIKMPWLSKTGLFVNTKGWDGYPAERRNLLSRLRNNQLNNNIFVSGDIHMFIGMDVVENPFEPSLYNRNTGKGSIGVDFCPSSISRGNIDETIGFYPTGNVRTLVNNVIQNINPHMRFFNGFDHGYGLLDIQPERTIGEFWSSPILTRSHTEQMKFALATYSGDNHWSREKIDTPTKPKEDYPPLAPPVDTNVVSSSKELSLPVRISEIYPHPMHRISYLDIIPETPQQLIVSVLDYTGKMKGTLLNTSVSAHQSYKITLDNQKLNLTKGMYFISVSDGQYTVYKKLIVQ